MIQTKETRYMLWMIVTTTTFVVMLMLLSVFRLRWHRHFHIERFTPIQQENQMTPLAAGFTADFATTALPAGASISTPATWESSDIVNAPVLVNPTDPQGLSASVTFPASVAAGVSFSLTVKYINPSGNVVSQTDSFTTVAVPAGEITGFTAIIQTS
jgi:hypothetical protein